MKPFTKYAVRIMRIPNIISILISNLESIIRKKEKGKSKK